MKTPLDTFLYFTTPSGYRVTLACHLNNGIVNTGVAVCSPCDRFTKERGRKIAKGRQLNGADWMKFTVNVGDEPHWRKLVEEKFWQQVKSQKPYEKNRGRNLKESMVPNLLYKDAENH